MRVSTLEDAAIVRLAKLFAKKHARQDLDATLRALGIERVPISDKYTKIYYILWELYKSESKAGLSRVIDVLVSTHVLEPEEINQVERDRGHLGVAQVVSIDLGPYGGMGANHDTRRMIRAFATLRTLENQLREFIDLKLREHFGDEWWASHSSSDAKRSADRARAKEVATTWQSVMPDSDIHYTDFKNLKSIVSINWSVFEGVFVDQTMVFKKLEELELVRNIIAHNRTLSEIELTRLELYAHDILKAIGAIKD